LVIPEPPAEQLTPVVVKPVHAPPVQVDVAHATALPHCPPEPQVSTPLPEHL
jgi:hypothetical protein